jgi:hypothetical protein
LTIAISVAAGLNFGHVEQPDPIQSSGWTRISVQLSGWDKSFCPNPRNLYVTGSVSSGSGCSTRGLGWRICSTRESGLNFCPKSNSTARLIAINDSFQRHKSFLNIQRFESNKTSLNLIQNVNTRWNNTFLMMKRAFALKINVINWLNREFFNSDQKRRTRDIFKKLMMIEIEWKEIKYMMNFLRSFYQWTQKIDQSRDFIIQFVFTAYNSFFDHLENQKKKRHRERILIKESQDDDIFNAKQAFYLLWTNRWKTWNVL